ncbi:MAG TPA: tRNA (guanosine(37)-N1)-methyltransferase TrmD [Candidatus Levybacteria bacterium]|nr:tRNA (guanosine(37)-N1)-methyltransferase TrmD [Candidatus Levybacteria bacterium]
MHISVITLFPKMFSNVIDSSILKRAQEKKKISIEIIDLRQFGIGKHKSVDDKPYGGGAGMLLRVDVLHKAIMHIKSVHPDTTVLLLGPKGTPFTQEVAENLTNKQDITLICGHYEGIDARAYKYIDSEISLGDFILTGGEIPAMAVIDAVTRLIPGVLGKNESYQNESFTSKNGKRILEGHHYTRPHEYDNETIPAELLSGDPLVVESFREKTAESETQKKRPDLY